MDIIQLLFNGKYGIVHICGLIAAYLLLAVEIQKGIKNHQTKKTKQWIVK
jgi:prolipoprotein diacylglyceryltransferase